MLRISSITILLSLACLGSAGTPAAAPGSSNLSGPPVLTVSPLIRGQATALTVTGLSVETVDRNVWFGYSLKGPGPSTRTIGPCGKMTINLTKKIVRLGPTKVKAGFTVATGAVNVPISAPIGTQAWFQAVDLHNCILTNGVTDVVQ